MDARRTRALIRDEGRLRTALDEQEKRRFDVNTALIVKYRVEDLLETVGLIVRDDDFWMRLSGLDRPPSSVQLERVRELDPLAFAALLEAAGYSSPPPPPPDELVDDTIQELVVALTSPTTVYPDQVGGARWQLQTLIMRVRRQISERETPELAPSILRSSARSLGRAARWLIPPVVAATAGALVEAYIPGSGIGHLAGRAAERTAENLAQLGAEMLVGDPAPVSAAVSVDEPRWTEIDPVSVHLAAVSDELHRLTIATHYNMPAEIVRQIASDARRHLNRIQELANDGSSETIEVAAHINGIGHLLDALSQLILMTGDPPVSVAQMAIEVVEGLREELQRAAEPRPEEGHGRPMPA